jgi:serine/threonine protein kinase/tetratricopeptide (TPR) repeat protein
MLTNGTLLHGRYRIVRLIGSGGMGAVYEAIDCHLDLTVAVKQCRLPGADASSSFEREAKLLAALRHPSLPVVLDYFTEDEAQFLIMQFIEGEDLGRLLDRSGDRIPPAVVVGWARTLLDVLCYLHNNVPPVVHRDIKPANIKRTPLGEIVLLDFGLAKGRSGDVTTSPADRSVFGYTLMYSPPEQIHGQLTDPRSDVYAVGATLYHLLTGRPPMNARDRARVVGSGSPDPLPLAHVVVAAVPENLGRLIGRAVALDPTVRWSSAREMRAALNECDVDQTTRVALPDHRGESRRIDAAVPSRATVGRRIDLLVQVRFGSSPRLGPEDWPSKEPPSSIEQASEAFQLAYPTDPQTGRLLAARLRLKVIAPDFKVENQSDRLIEAPPDEYSKRVAFLLTPLRTGPCGINVEVYRLDDLFLGTVLVETEVLAATVAGQEISVGTLMLDVVARQVAALLLGAGVASAVSPASPATQHTDSAAITMLASGGTPIEPPKEARSASPFDAEWTEGPALTAEAVRRRQEAEASAARASAESTPTGKTVQTSKTLPGAKTIPAAKPSVGEKRGISPLASGASVAVLVVVGIVAAMLFRRAPTEPPPVVSVTTTVPATTSVPAPSGPTPEEQFLDHYNKAQLLMASGNKEGAAAENAEALKLLPSDPRGVQQQATIAAIKDAAAVTAGATTKVPPTATETSPLTVAARAGETAVQRANREKRARTHLADGRKALDEKRFVDAVTLFQAAIETSGRDDYGTTPGEASNMLKRAQAMQAQVEAAAARASAQKLFDDAKVLANADLVGAVQKLRDARAADPQLPGVTGFLSSLQDRAAKEGEDAFIRGKNFDAVNRYDEAIRQYERAVQLLGLVPGGHKYLQPAKDNLAALKAKR